MSTFELQHPFTYSADEATPLQERLGQWTLARDEAATLWYALSAYKAQLVNDAAQATTRSDLEDEMFLFQHASKVAKLMFDLRDNHTPPTNAEECRAWLDTE